MELMTKELEEKFKKYNMENQIDLMGKAKVLVKYFNPCGAGTWFIVGAEKEKDDFYMYGYCHLGDDENAEMGGIMLSSLEQLKLPMGLKIERDLYINQDLDLLTAIRNSGFIPPNYMVKNYENKEDINYDYEIG